MTAGLNGVFCLEGQWTGDLSDTASVLPTLEHLERARELRFIHRHVATRDEVAYYFGRLRTRAYDRYRVVYLSMHGDRGGILLNPNDRQLISLAELAELMQGACVGRYIYLGSCATLLTSQRALNDFVRGTGARLLCGYTKSVDWTEASAFDILLLTNLVNQSYRSGTKKYLEGKVFGSWSSHLGLKFVVPRGGGLAFSAELLTPRIECSYLTRENLRAIRQSAFSWFSSTSW